MRVTAVVLGVYRVVLAVVALLLLILALTSTLLQRLIRELDVLLAGRTELLLFEIVLQK
jgi:hypothetical protein